MEWLFIAAVIGTLISSGISAYSVYKNNDTQKELARQANQFNAEQAQINRDFQTKSIDNSVAAALRSGINPDIFASGSVPTYSGDSATANMAQTQPFKMPDFGQSLLSSVQGYQAAQTASKERELMESQIQKNEADSNLSYTQSELNRATKEYYDELKINIAAGTNLTNQQINLVSQQCNEIGARIRKINEEIKNLVADRGLTEEKTLLTGLQVDNFCEQLAKQMQVWDSEIVRNIASGKLSVAQIGLVSEQKNYLKSQTNLVEVDRYIKSLQMYSDFGIIPKNYDGKIPWFTGNLYKQRRMQEINSLNVSNDRMQFDLTIDKDNAGWISLGKKLQSVSGFVDAFKAGVGIARTIALIAAK